MLTNWNFKDEAANSATQQINRQKSAQNLQVIQFDPSEPRAVFFDPKRGVRHTATLTECDCSDFNLAGTNPRKTFKPCMHIYRVAIELGLLEAKYLDHQARFALAAAMAREETQRLQQLPPDATQWGGWEPEVHRPGIQRNRQYRAYSITGAVQDTVQQSGGSWIIHGYSTTLDRCDCMDFLDRKLPCKHIYAAALAFKIRLPFSEVEYETARSQGLEIIFEFSTGS
jgi:SWIM zinc finger